VKRLKLTPSGPAKLWILGSFQELVDDSVATFVISGLSGSIAGTDSGALPAKDAPAKPCITSNPRTRDDRAADGDVRRASRETKAQIFANSEAVNNAQLIQYRDRKQQVNAACPVLIVSPVYGSHTNTTRLVILFEFKL
jgi:hypothetical protein